jgi:hypothetical protein
MNVLLRISPYFVVSMALETAVSSVWPAYGPQSGGTKLTITGQSLDVTTVTAVKVGNTQLIFDRVNR